MTTKIMVGITTFILFVALSVLFTGCEYPPDRIPGVVFEDAKIQCVSHNGVKFVEFGKPPSQSTFFYNVACNDEIRITRYFDKYPTNETFKSSPIPSSN